MPQEFQIAPINNFAEVSIGGESQILVSGNTNKVNTYHGAYTSLKGIVMKDLNHFNLVSNYGVKPFDEQIKKVISLNMKDERMLIVVANNDTLNTYVYKK